MKAECLRHLSGLAIPSPRNEHSRLRTDGGLRFRLGRREPGDVSKLFRYVRWHSVLGHHHHIAGITQHTDERNQTVHDMLQRWCPLSGTTGKDIFKREVGENHLQENEKPGMRKGRAAGERLFRSVYRFRNGLSLLDWREEEFRLTSRKSAAHCTRPATGTGSTFCERQEL